MRAGATRIGGLLLVLVASGVAAQTVDDPEAFARFSAKAVATIATETAQIVAMRDAAKQKGAALQTSCLEEQVARAQSNLDTAKQIDQGAEVAGRNRTFAERSRQRMLLLMVYSTVYAEAARQCAGVIELRQGLVEVHQTSPAQAGGVDHDPFELKMPSGADPNRPPQLCRPPLASPY